MSKRGRIHRSRLNVDGEHGQILPFAVIGILGAVLLTSLMARGAMTMFERTRTQTAADATALSAATAYARGLNICAVSNQVLFGAAVVDVAVTILTGLMAKVGLPPDLSATELVMKFQDMWVGLAGYSPGIAPVMMDTAAYVIGAENELGVIVLWNGGGWAYGSAFPSLNVKRATLAEFMALLAGGRITPRGGGRRPPPLTITKETEERYSYQPRAGGPRVEVSKSRVEKVWFKRGGKTVVQYRLKTTGGGKAGQFVRAERKAGGGVGSMKIILPLIESSPIHEVLVIGLHERFLRSVSARAETGGGEVFNLPFFGDPYYDVRLIKVPVGLGDPARLFSSW